MSLSLGSLANKEAIQIMYIIFAGSTGNIVVCISPLTALMMDQQAKFAGYGLSTEFVGEAQTDK